MVATEVNLADEDTMKESAQEKLLNIANDLSTTNFRICCIIGGRFGVQKADLDFGDRDETEYL
jgi:hypothetical protein